MSEMTMKMEYVGLQDRVLARVKDAPGETPRQIADYLEADYNSVTRALSRLARRGQVFAVEGQYSPVFTDLGELVRSTFGLPPFVAKTPWYRRWRRLARFGGWLAYSSVLGVSAGLSYMAGYYDWLSWLYQK